MQFAAEIDSLHVITQREQIHVQKIKLEMKSVLKDTLVEIFSIGIWNVFPKQSSSVSV